MEPERPAPSQAGAPVSDPRLVVLSHPLESTILAKTGYSWSDLFWQGRYVAITNMICRQCGTIFERQRLAPPGNIGCMTSFSSGVVCGVAAGIWARSFLAGVVAWYAVMILVGLVAGSFARLYTRRRFAERAASLAAERACPRCHAEDAVTIERAKTVTCPTCSAQSLRFTMIGKS